MSSFSVSDYESQGRAIMPHFLFHYMERLGISRQNVLLLIHAQKSHSRKTYGRTAQDERVDRENLFQADQLMTKVEKHLQRDFQIYNTYRDYAPYTSIHHLRLRMAILKRHVGYHDWVLHSDSDEFVFFPELDRHAELCIDKAKIRNKDDKWKRCQNVHDLVEYLDHLV